MKLLWGCTIEYRMLVSWRTGEGNKGKGAIAIQRTTGTVVRSWPCIAMSHALTSVSLEIGRQCRQDGQSRCGVVVDGSEVRKWAGLRYPMKMRLFKVRQHS